MFNLIKSMLLARKGKAFGNEVADYIGMHRSLYHGAMEEGGCSLHMIKLAAQKDDGMSLEEAAHFSIPFLLPGLRTLEDKFGSQDLILHARRQVYGLISNRMLSTLYG